MDKCREEFEAEMAKLGDCVDMRRAKNGDEEYMACDAALAWRMWKKSRENIASILEGMDVSIDVSTCDEDSGNRYFGSITECVELDGCKNGLMLLVQNAEPNFKVY